MQQQHLLYKSQYQLFNNIQKIEPKTKISNKYFNNKTKIYKLTF